MGVAPGRRYGTMIVDLERNDVIDLLPDRSAASLAELLPENRTVTEATI